jgi:thymidylate synthase (FAD)
MIVTLVAATELVDLPRSVAGTPFVDDISPKWHNAGFNENADRLAHFAGRSCYQAWNMPNPATADDMGYLANILKQGHFSVLEHGSATFYIEGVSRNLTHELIRHRHLSYSELSQRYVNMEDAEFVLPPAMRDTEYPDMFGHERLTNVSKDEYADAVHDLEQLGIKGKKAREAARYLLPSGMETKIVVSGNHRAWRDMLQKRYSVHADAEIRELATELLKQLRLLAPGTYQDFPEEPFA